MELQQLANELQKNIAGEIVETRYWNIPVHTVNVSYKPIVKTKMDILMKMILLSVKEASFTNGQQISEILLVEQLFIEDLLKKMQKANLIDIVDGTMQLTSKGENQLQNGIFEEEQPVQTTELLYSPVHQSFVVGDIEVVFDFDDFPEEMYRHASSEEQLSINEETIIQHIQQLELEDEEQDEQPEEKQPIIIQSIESYETFQINDVPCIEFSVRNKDNSNLVAKVWNTLKNNWDETLELDLKENGI